MESGAFSIEPWTAGSFILEMKPRTEYASLFVSCPKFGGKKDEEEPYELVRLEEQMLEMSIDQPRNLSSSSGSEEELNLLAANKVTKKKMSTKFSDILLDPSTICSISWADQAQELLMCKVKAEADYSSFTPKTIKRLEEELIQVCHLKEYVERIEHNKNFTVKCKQCGIQIHSHTKSEFEFGILPNDEWLDLSPQFDYFCGLSGSDCCAQHLERAAQNPHYREGILGFSGGFSPESTRHWLPSERKIVLSNSFILFHKNDSLKKTINEKQIATIPESLLHCSNCNVQIGKTLKNRLEIYKLHFSVLNVHGDKSRQTSYIENRFHSMECFLAWILLNKCEHQSSMKLLIRSLDKTPQLLIWLLEPYVLFTKGVLKEISTEENELIELAKRTSNSISNQQNSSISFPALKILYKLFDSDASKQDPRANGGDSSVGILEVPMGCCLQLIESLLTSSMALPPPLRALGQFYVGFIRLKDRVD